MGVHFYTRFSEISVLMRLQGSLLQLSNSIQQMPYAFVARDMKYQFFACKKKAGADLPTQISP